MRAFRKHFHKAYILRILSDTVEIRIDRYFPERFAHRQLIIRIEVPDCFYLIAEEIDTERLLIRKGIDIHQTAAQREFSRLRHGHAKCKLYLIQVSYYWSPTRE